MTDIERAGLAAIEREEYDLAVRLLLDPARAGSAQSQYLLGYLYFTSADADARESRAWLERAAAQRHPEALFRLSQWRDDGAIGAPDTEGGRSLLLEAAELGVLQAQRDLGCYYAIGEGGFPLDPRLGRLWYGRAAEGGHADAQYNYGLMLLFGEGGPAEPEGGKEWLGRAAAQGDTDAIDYLTRNA